MATKKVKKRKYHYEGEEVASDIHAAKKIRAAVRMEQKPKKKSFWQKAKDWGNKDLPSIEKYPYPIREPVKVAMIPPSQAKDWLGTQKDRSFNWRERRRLKREKKNKELEEKQKQKIKEIEQAVKKSPKEKRDKALEKAKNLRIKHAKQQEINNLRDPLTGELKEEDSIGLKPNHIGSMDLLLGRKPKKLSHNAEESLKKNNPKNYKKYIRQRNRWDSKLARKQKVRDWSNRHFTDPKSFRKRWLSKGGAYKAGKEITHTTSRAILRTGQATARLGEAVSTSAAQSVGPIQIFQMAWARMSVTLKWLIIIVFMVVILFVPWGIFYYAGWAVGAAFMFLISLIYWVIANFFNGIAYVLVSIINGIVRVIMGVVIFIVEVILDFFTVGTGDTYSDGTPIQGRYWKWVPDPTWVARFRPKEGVATPWDHEGFLEHRLGYAIYVYPHYWYEGRVLLDSSLIRYEQLANIPALMFVSPPPWQDWMYNIIIVKLLEHIPGLGAVIKGWGESFGKGMSDAMANFVATAPPWLVILVGCIPFFIVIGIVLYVYYKNREKYNLSSY